MGYSLSTPINVEVGISTSNEAENTKDIPLNFALDQNFPNPFRSTTTIPFVVPSPSNVKLSVFDVSGRHVKDLIDRYVQPGKHSLEWSGKGLTSGVYFIRLLTDEGMYTRQVTLLK